jgi:hypothetical protein
MLTEKEQTAVREVISRGQRSGQSEAVAIADWMEGVYGEEDMDLELILTGLEELELWAKSMREELRKKLGSKTCHKCGSTIHENGRCSDLTCPFNDRPQDATYTEG